MLNPALVRPGNPRFRAGRAVALDSAKGDSAAQRDSKAERPDNGRPNVARPGALSGPQAVPDLGRPPVVASSARRLGSLPNTGSAPAAAVIVAGTSRRVHA